MPTLNIEGIGTVKVDDSFATLAPAEQEKAIEEIAAQIKNGSSAAPPAVPQLGAAPAPAPPGGRGSFLDPLVQGITMGAADEIKGGLRGGARHLFGDNPGKGLGDLYGEEVGKARENLESFRGRHPVLSPALEIGGAGLGVLGTGGASLVPRAATTAGRVALGAAEGSALGGAYGFNAGEGSAKERLPGAAIGAATGAPLGAAGGAIGAALGRGTKQAAPALDDLRSASRAAFAKVDASGATVRPAKTDKIITDIVSVARKQKINRSLHPDSYAALEETVAYRGTTPTVSDLHQLRQIIADAAASPKPGDRRIASMMIDKLDDQIDKLNAFDVTGGDPKATVASLREGMETWRRLRKGETIAKIFSNAEIDAGAKYTQAGMETAIRNGFKLLAKNEKKMRGFSAEERAAIRKVATGGPIENTARFFGKFAPRGVISAIPALGAASYDLGAGAALMLGAEGSRQAATAMTRRNARVADELIRRGGPAAPKKPLTPSEQMLLAQGLGSGLPMGPMVDRQFNR